MSLHVPGAPTRSPAPAPSYRRVAPERSAPAAAAPEISRGVASVPTLAEPRGRRALELLTVLVVLVLMLPLLISLALAVRCTSRGPVLFRQVRVGAGGRPITVLKFRSMVVDAEARRAALEHRNERTGPLFKIRDDPRVTAVGRWMRRYSLDELPQLLNVVSGSMSLVGPRPALPSEAAAFDLRSSQRHAVRPGVTGLAQVNGRSDLPWPRAIQLDLEYVERRSLRLDALILLRTLPAVVLARGAY